ncbi:SURF1 family protein [Pseudooceanicola algae]|uniref:SURF1-like protein n=1 Tax=Pseudooceanicola algae TaxID=1537215 RepID=A0A418SI70_9RHOB|nr:SURF1 family protein [Pseudooceanicola algae]QPM88954.1 hypothetical protein PSAL_001570 [Pseudooceanicola algae]
MRGKLIGSVVLGAAGLALLVSLGNWQVRRLDWKLGVIDRIETRMAAAPVALPVSPDPEADAYRAVEVAGRFTGRTLRVQSAMEGFGAGYHLIQALETPADGSLLIDRGFVPQGQPLPPAPTGAVTITGNLLWPDEQDGFTPDPDRQAGLFYARDVPSMAGLLGTRALMVVRRDGPAGGGALVVAPVGTAGIRNDHRGYAITWYSLAAVWLVMSGFLIYRMAKQSKGKAA